jgi:hypothetical protein
MAIAPAPPSGGKLCSPELRVRLQRARGVGPVEVVAEEPQAAAVSVAIAATEARATARQERIAQPSYKTSAIDNFEKQVESGWSGCLLGEHRCQQVVV